MFIYQLIYTKFEISAQQFEIRIKPMLAPKLKHLNDVINNGVWEH